MATTWTVVFLPHRYSPHFQPTGFAGTWDAAATEASRLAQGELAEAFEVYYCSSTDTELTTDRGSKLKIAPTKEAKAAAKARRAAIGSMVRRDDFAASGQGGWSALRGFGGSLGITDKHEVAAYAVDNGMTLDDVRRTQA